ncbi:hypothetical protein J4E91_006528 [Alternaria rosae]|nr:hypothetical protein J4E91_006528 [Alternaria rosae]
MSMSKYDTILWEKEMKEQISHVRVIFSREPTPSSPLDIINAKVPGPTGSIYKSHLVKWHSSSSTAWKFLCSSQSKVSFAESLEVMLEGLRGDLSPTLGFDAQKVYEKTSAATQDPHPSQAHLPSL